MELNPLGSAYSPLQVYLKTMPWWMSLAAFAAYALLLFLIQWALFRALRRWTVKRQSPWYGLVLAALQNSILLFLFSGMIGLVPVLFRMSKDWRKYGAVAAELVAILAFAVFFQKLLVAAYRRYVAKDEGQRTYSELVRGLISVAVYSVFLLIFLETAGISITPLVASLGIGSVAVAFALQETLASLFAGLYLVTDKPIRIGDYVKLENDIEGYVEAMGWKSVRIRTLLNNIVIVPNAKLSGGVITNYTLIDRDVIVTVNVSVAYGSPLETVEQVTLEVARESLQEVREAVSGFDPGIRWTSFGDSGVEFSVLLKARDFAGQIPLRNAFIRKLHGRYLKEGIVIPYPTRTLLMNPDFSSKKQARESGQVR